jgi:hypothetical protein
MTNTKTKDEKMREAIIHFLWLTKRGSVARILTAVRRNGVADATKQEVSSRCAEMARTGTLALFSSGRRPVYRLSDDKEDELHDKREAERRERKANRDRIEAERIAEEKRRSQEARQQDTAAPASKSGGAING